MTPEEQSKLDSIANEILAVLQKHGVATEEFIPQGGGTLKEMNLTRDIETVGNSGEHPIKQANPKSGQILLKIVVKGQ